MFVTNYKIIDKLYLLINCQSHNSIGNQNKIDKIIYIYIYIYISNGKRDIF